MSTSAPAPEESLYRRAVNFVHIRKNAQDPGIWISLMLGSALAFALINRRTVNLSLGQIKGLECGLLLALHRNPPPTEEEFAEWLTAREEEGFDPWHASALAQMNSGVAELVQVLLSLRSRVENELRKTTDQTACDELRKTLRWLNVFAQQQVPSPNSPREASI